MRVLSVGLDYGQDPDAAWQTLDDGDRAYVARYALGRDYHKLLRNRLQLTDLITRHPEITGIRLAPPVVIAGLPRTGTTHLHNLLAAAPTFRTLPYWESIEPVPRPTEIGLEPDPRRTRTDQAVWFADLAMPHFRLMHEMTTDHVHEEIQLLANDFSTMFFETLGEVPAWRDHYLAHDQTPHYAYMKRVLQILQWTRPRERWVLKSPQHLEQLGPLLATFPDATIVVTHRDPVAVIQSTITMLAYGARNSYRTPRPEWYRDYWSDRIRRLLEASVRDRELLPAGRTVDVLFHEFMADDFATVERIYEAAGLPMTDAARGEIQGHLREHPRGREGQVVYDLRRDFDAEPAELRRPFGFYLERFPVRVEVS